jgi:predicted nucleic acid-binding protein
VADIVLDTTFFVDLHRAQHPGALALWESIERGEVSGSYSPLTVYELWVGLRLDGVEEAFYDSMFLLLEEAPLTSAAAKNAGSWLRQIRGSITEALVRDALIAATAAAMGSNVCTLNRRDFMRFPVPIQAY